MVGTVLFHYLRSTPAKFLVFAGGSCENGQGWMLQGSVDGGSFERSLRQNLDEGIRCRMCPDGQTRLATSLEAGSGWMGYRVVAVSVKPLMPSFHASLQTFRALGFGGKMSRNKAASSGTQNHT